MIVDIRDIGRVAIGPMRESERGFVTHGYAEAVADSMGHGPKSHSRHRGRYLSSLGREVERLLADRSAMALVARDDEAGALAYGFVVYKSPLLCWVYVKPPWKDTELRRELTELAAADGCTHFAYHSRWDALIESVGLAYQHTSAERTG